MDFAGAKSITDVAVPSRLDMAAPMDHDGNGKRSVRRVGPSRMCRCGYNRGGIFCNMGPTGNDKSTLARRFNRSLAATDAQIRIQWNGVVGLGPQALQSRRNRKIGTVFQNDTPTPHRAQRHNVAIVAG